MEGFFITFEGIEGTGKSTQAKALFEALDRRGLPVRLTREPGGTKIGDMIRDILMDPNCDKMDGMTEFLLFEASRTQHIRELLRPALEEGYIVISDRFFDSSVAYQGFGRGIPLGAIGDINAAAAWGIVPNLTVYLDMEPKKAFDRVNLRLQEREDIPDRLEREKLEFFGQVRDGYLSLARNEPHRIRTFDAQMPPEELHRKILDIIVKELKRAGFHSFKETEGNWNLERFS